MGNVESHTKNTRRIVESNIPEAFWLDRFSLIELSNICHQDKFSYYVLFIREDFTMKDTWIKGGRTDAWMHFYHFISLCKGTSVGSEES